MMSVAEVLELVPGQDGGDPTWINPGFIAVVGEIKSVKTRQGSKPMHICTLHDTSNEGIEISMTVFAPTTTFASGDTIQILGKGLRRTEYNGLDQVSIGKETEIQVLKRGTRSGPPPKNSTPVPNQRTPDASGPSKHVPSGRETQGVTVGMAINNAVQILIHNAGASGDVPAPVDLPSLQSKVENIAAVLIEASKRLESGKVTAAEDVPY